MKVLHMTYHRGCGSEIEYVSEKLGFDLETVYADWNYNIGPERATEIWGRLKDRIKACDLVLTSDTAPLSRIVLQHASEYAGKVLVWVCNRVDYADGATNDCAFPDQAYYSLLNKAHSEGSCRIIGYTDYEIPYAERKGVRLAAPVIKPTGYGSLNLQLTTECLPPDEKIRSVFVPPYHNDTLFMDLRVKCQSLGLEVHAGRYNGPRDLKGFKAIVHIPYAWSTFAFFEMMALGVPYLIPSLSFFRELSSQFNFWWQNMEDIDKVELSEWYHPDHRHIVTYFDSWNDLRAKVDGVDFKRKSEEIVEYSESHVHRQLSSWHQVLKGMCNA